MLRTLLIARLFLTKPVANHAMIRATLRRRHSRLPAVLATLVALALEIIFLRHLFFLRNVKSPTALDGPLFRKQSFTRAKPENPIDWNLRTWGQVESVQHFHANMSGGPDVSNSRRFSHSTSAPMGCPAYFWLPRRRHQRRLWRAEPRG